MLFTGSGCHGDDGWCCGSQQPWGSPRCTRHQQSPCGSHGTSRCRSQCDAPPTCRRTRRRTWRAARPQPSSRSYAATHHSGCRTCPRCQPSWSSSPSFSANTEKKNKQKTNKKYKNKKRKRKKKEKRESKRQKKRIGDSFWFQKTCHEKRYKTKIFNDVIIVTSIVFSQFQNQISNLEKK